MSRPPPFKHAAHPARAGSFFVALAITATLVLVGCARNPLVTVDSSFPSPLVETLPLRMGVYLSDELKNYAYEEALPQDGTWTFELGTANVQLFQPLFEGMFDQVVLAESRTLNSQNNLDGVLEPRMEKFEFDLPRGEHSPFAEVWVQYRIHLYAADGTPVANWTVSGYGRSPAASSDRTPSGPLEDAAVRAMREAGAHISMRFRSQPEVSDWLESIQHARTTLGSSGEPDGG